jgi:sulfatase modifying factor 1
VSTLAVAAGGAAVWLAVGWPPLAYGLGLGLLALAGYQARRVELRLSGADLPRESTEAEEAEAGLAPRAETGPEPPYVVEDPRITVVALPGGAFWMGSDPKTDPQARDDEAPRHRVRLSRFAMAEVPVSRELYRSLMGDVPAEWTGSEDEGRLPANDVSWRDAVRFCNALSEASGFTSCYREEGGDWRWDRAADGYRLPSEAEWEYACRAGTETPWFWGAEESDAGRYAWFSGNSGIRVHPVKSKAPNPWGLYDLAGNVWEWCWDWYGEYRQEEQQDPEGPPSAGWRVLRGGSFFDMPWDLRSASRLGFGPLFRPERIGFRCVRGSGRL